MASELDHRFDDELASLVGPAGRLVLGRDTRGRPVVANLPSTLPEFFRTFCALNGTNEAIVAGDERLSFADVDRISDEVALGLRARGIEKGDRVAIAMRNCPSWILTYMAALKAGAIATLLNSWWEPLEMEHAIRLADPKLVIADERRAERIGARCSRDNIIGLPIEKPWQEALAQLLGEPGTNSDLPAIEPEDDATILFTSGSTGLSKGAVSTHQAVTTGTYSYTILTLALLGLLSKEGRAPETPPRILVSVPLFHVTGEVPVMLNSFVIGRCMVMMAKWDALHALTLIERERITYFIGVPTMSLELMNHPDRQKFDLSSLRDIAAGGAPRPVSHVERLQGAFPDAQPGLGYGLTETNAVGCTNFWSNYGAKPASTGRAQSPLIEVAIRGEDDADLGPNEIGEIAIRSAANIKCYWNNEEATADLFTADGFVLTGDVGFLDDDGYLFIVDRKKDIIIRGGENIAAAEIEAELYACNSIDEVCAFGIPDERLGEVPVAIVHKRDGKALSEGELLQFLEGRLARFKIPEQIIVAEDPLPRLGTGKIDRRALKTQYAR